MTATLNDVKLNNEKKSEPSAEEIAAKELVRLAKEKCLSFNGRPRYKRSRGQC